MYYTMNLSPLLVTKKGFMLIIILSNYQQCPLPLNRTKTLVSANAAASTLHYIYSDTKFHTTNRSIYTIFLLYKYYKIQPPAFKMTCDIVVQESSKQLDNVDINFVYIYILNYRLYFIQLTQSKGECYRATQYRIYLPYRKCDAFSSVFTCHCTLVNDS